MATAPNNKRVVHLKSYDEIPLHKSKQPWVRSSEVRKSLTKEDAEMWDLVRNIRSILNKLTPQMFSVLVQEMHELPINSRKKLEKTIHLIFETAVTQPLFSAAYANMCRSLSQKSFPEDDKPITFRQLLLNKCQSEFEKDHVAEKELKEFATEKEVKEWQLELELREQKRRRRMLGNIRFIGELFKIQMISESIMHMCVVKLLNDKKPSSIEDSLECLCKLLNTIGKNLDKEEARRRMDQYFIQLKKIVDKKKTSNRIRFAIQDIIDLRINNWVPRVYQIHKGKTRKKVKTKTNRKAETARSTEVEKPI